MVLMGAGREWIGEKGGRYQSEDWGGSSLEWEVLTVSTQPRCRWRMYQYISVSSKPGKGGAIVFATWSPVVEPVVVVEKVRCTWDRELSLSLEKVRVFGDELLCLQSTSCLASALSQGPSHEDCHCRTSLSAGTRPWRRPTTSR